jgi:hypothetical protein
MIDLGKKQDMGVEVASMPEPEEKKVYYPTLYLSDVSGDFPDVGSEGTATIKFRVVSKSESERKDSDGGVKERKSIDIDVMGISFDSKGMKEKSSAEDEIEKGLSESEKEMEEED